MCRQDFLDLKKKKWDVEREQITKSWTYVGCTTRVRSIPSCWISKLVGGVKQHTSLSLQFDIYRLACQPVAGLLITTNERCPPQRELSQAASNTRSSTSWAGDCIVGIGSFTHLTHASLSQKHLDSPHHATQNIVASRKTQVEPYGFPDVAICPTSGGGCDAEDPSLCSAGMRLIVSALSVSVAALVVNARDCCFSCCQRATHESQHGCREKRTQSRGLLS